MMRALFEAQKLLICALLVAVAVSALAACQTGNTGSPGNTPNIAPQSSYRVVGDVGTPFQALISDSRSSWQVSATIPMNIVIVNDSPPDRILVTKLTNDHRMLTLQLIQGFTVGTIDSTVSNFGTAVGNIGGTLRTFANPASPDVRFFVKTPLAGTFTGLIEDESLSNALESRVPAIILFDHPNNGKSGRVDGVFNQVAFIGVLDVDLVINGQLVQAASGGNSVTVKGG